jgi:antitoxin component of MazEF toxin-antitoxin module
MKVGSQFGLIVPKEILDACGFGQEASITVKDGMLIVAPGSRQPRAGWEEALSAIPQRDLDRDFAELAALRETPHAWDNQPGKPF